MIERERKNKRTKERKNEKTEKVQIYEENRMSCKKKLQIIVKIFKDEPRKKEKQKDETRIAKQIAERT